MKPLATGMAAPKTMVRACMVKSWLKVSGPTMFRPGWASWVRMSRASRPPRRKTAVPLIM